MNPAHRPVPPGKQICSSARPFCICWEKHRKQERKEKFHLGKKEQNLNRKTPNYKKESVFRKRSWAWAVKYVHVWGERIHHEENSPKLQNRRILQSGGTGLCFLKDSKDRKYSQVSGFTTSTTQDKSLHSLSSTLCLQSQLISSAVYFCSPTQPYVVYTASSSDKFTLEPSSLTLNSWWKHDDWDPQISNYSLENNYGIFNKIKTFQAKTLYFLSQFLNVFLNADFSLLSLCTDQLCSLLDWSRRLLNPPPPN